MNWVGGVDVGVKYYAHAWVFHCKDGWELRRAALVPYVEPIRPPEASVWLPGDRLVIECATPRQRDGQTKIREVNALNRAAGRLGALHPSPEFLLPERWKGQTPKKIDHERTLAALSPEELNRLPKSKAELKHVLDAVGIALKAVGRR